MKILVEVNTTQLARSFGARRTEIEESLPRILGHALMPLSTKCGVKISVVLDEPEDGE